jgi:predicted O-methyltransferase YrrM
MGLKHWPVIRDARFALKCGRYLRGAQKRRPDLNWREFRRIAAHFRDDDMGSLAERGYLFQLANDLPQNARVVEIGSWTGASTCFIAAGLRGSTPAIMAVDNFQGLSTCPEDVVWYQRYFKKEGRESTLPVFQRNVNALEFSRRISPVVSDSLAFARQMAAGDSQADFVFVDGDHSYAACAADIAAWTPLVKSGGIIAFHDFGSRAHGVTRAIFEAIKAGKFAEIIGVAGTIVAFRR